MILAAAALAALPACESGFDRNDQIVNSLRILGVRAHVVGSNDGMDWADAEVGDTLELSALVTNPANVAVTINWLACVPTGTAMLTKCNDAGVLQHPVSLIAMANDPQTGVINLGTTNPVQFTVPSEVQPLLQATLDRVDPSATPTPNPQAECSLFVNFPLIVILQGSDGEVFTATQNIRLSPWSQVGPMNATKPQFQYYIRNANPQIGGFFSSPPERTVCSGQPLTVLCQTDGDCAAFSAGATCQSGFCSPGTFPDGDQTICLALDAPQEFYDCGLDGPELPQVQEQPTVTWYATSGSIGTVGRPNAGTGTDLASMTYGTFTRTPGPFTIYGVVRDGRGGENWLAQDFQ